MWKDSETELDFLDYDYWISVLKDTITDDSLLPASTPELTGDIKKVLQILRPCQVLFDKKEGY